ncbi:Uncharacterised protein [Staphylococcus saprophyticus]|uniref:hypothetical protein n=1 Tax=Staphylococcus saprophyticus TaxID=29385 RepID=UPI000DFF123D|nr:hypothetical protein [Staphylococcus saprophyticus]SUM75960.1 Uncharacterised protein [Staphylococcus saprophyticus]
MELIPFLFPISAKLDAVVTALPIHTKLFIPEDFLPAFTAQFLSTASPIPALTFGSPFSLNSLFNIFKSVT